MGYASREKYNENLPTVRCRRRHYAFSHIQLHRPNNVAVAVTGCGAMFAATRVLEHCQKEPKGRTS